MDVFIDSLFSDPLSRGSECCSKTTGTLAIGGRIIRRWRGFRLAERGTVFQTVLTRPGWYKLALTSRRFSPYGPEPAGILSPRMTLAWRFHARPTPPAGNWRDLPVTLTTFLPGGLDLANAARANSTTALRLHIERAGNRNNPAPRYRLIAVRLMVSYNGGTTWRSVPVKARRGFWLAFVHDPASGFISLRTVVTDAHGDRTTETVYRAYAVAGA